MGCSRWGDERNLFEVTHPDFPNERLVACRNPELAERRRHKRRALLEATSKELEKVCRMVERRRLQGKENIRAAVKKLLNKSKSAATTDSISVTTVSTSS